MEPEGAGSNLPWNTAYSEVSSVSPSICRVNISKPVTATYEYFQILYRKKSKSKLSPQQAVEAYRVERTLYRQSAHSWW
jgi:hypothetical protein